MKSVLTRLLVGYKRWISPAMPVACRYQPTCSDYAQQAIEMHGAGYGTLLAAWRLLRCHPLARGGFDPVPAGGRGCACGRQ